MTRVLVPCRKKCQGIRLVRPRDCATLFPSTSILEPASPVTSVPSLQKYISYAFEKIWIPLVVPSSAPLLVYRSKCVPSASSPGTQGHRALRTQLMGFRAEAIGMTPGLGICRAERRPTTHKSLLEPYPITTSENWKQGWRYKHWNHG